MAHKKAAWSAKNLRDSNPKYRGLKLAGGQKALAGNIIIRQKGDKYMAGNNVYKGKDFTLHAGIEGIVTFSKKNFVRFDGRRYLKTVVNVVPLEAVAEAAAKKAPAKAKAPAKKAAPKAAAKKTEAKAPAKKAAPAKAKAPAKKASAGSDDLTKIEGIGPVIAKLFVANGIATFADLSASKVGDLRKLLADNDLASHDPKTWKKQSTLAKNGKWDELKTLQDELMWGK